ncbi:MAG: preprotein translocase subunit SecE [Deltaproteobacteria bacterium]|nr:preprotein translocase subunit SecE [Deltaproteobacteria bacterium]
MGERKYVHLMFLTGGMVLAYVLIQATDWIWGFFYKPEAMKVFLTAIVLAGGSTYALWRSERVFQLASEVVAELRKVTWPTRKETSQAAVVVIVLVIIVAIILGVFDLFWSWATNLILT